VSLQFVEEGCGRCGGDAAPQCVGGAACGVPPPECDAAAVASNAGEERHRCQTYLHVGWTGWDRKWRVFESGAMNRERGGDLTGATGVYTDLQDRVRAGREL